MVTCCSEPVRGDASPDKRNSIRDRVEPHNRAFRDVRKNICGFSSFHPPMKLLLFTEKWKEVRLQVLLRNDFGSAFRCLHCVRVADEPFEIGEEDVQLAVDEGNVGCDGR